MAKDRFLNLQTLYDQISHTHVFIFPLAIYTAAMSMLAGNEAAAFCRKPDIMADAAYVILTSDPKKTTGNFYIDEDILKIAGVNNLDDYACVPENKDKLMPDFFISDTPVTDSAPGIKEMKENYLNKLPGKKTDNQSVPPTGKVAGLFYKIEQHLNPELIEKTQCVYQFNVSGEEAGTWYVIEIKIPKVREEDSR